MTCGQCRGMCLCEGSNSNLIDGKLSTRVHAHNNGCKPGGPADEGLHECEHQLGCQLRAQSGSSLKFCMQCGKLW